MTIPITVMKTSYVMLIRLGNVILDVQYIEIGRMHSYFPT
jgi:hypothetical protein